MIKQQSVVINVLLGKTKTMLLAANIKPELPWCVYNFFH